jgi:hypothetical protein
MIREASRAAVHGTSVSRLALGRRAEDHIIVESVAQSGGGSLEAGE